MTANPQVDTSGWTLEEKCSHVSSGLGEHAVEVAASVSQFTGQEGVGVILTVTVDDGAGGQHVLTGSNYTIEGQIEVLEERLARLKAKRDGAPMPDNLTNSETRTLAPTTYDHLQIPEGWTRWRVGDPIPVDLGETIDILIASLDRQVAFPGRENSTAGALRWIWEGYADIAAWRLSEKC